MQSTFWRHKIRYRFENGEKKSNGDLQKKEGRKRKVEKKDTA
jgi:hypothetical protein